MDLRLLLPVGLGLAILLLVLYFFGFLTPLLILFSVFGLFNSVVLFFVLLGLFVGVFRLQGILKLFCFGGLGVVLFTFVFYPLLFDMVSFYSFLSLGFIGFVLLVLLLFLLPPYPDIELLFIIPMKKYLGISLWLGEVVVLAVALLVFSFLAIGYPLAWSFLLGGLTDNLLLLVFFVALLVVLVVVGDKLLGLCT